MSTGKELPNCEKGRKQVNSNSEVPMPDPLAQFGALPNAIVATLVASLVDALEQMRAAHEVFATTAGAEEASEVRVLMTCIPRRLTRFGEPWSRETDPWDDWVLNELVNHLCEVGFSEDPYGDAPQ